MTRELTAAEAAALVRPKDSLGGGLGPAWPPALVKALAARDDWEDLRIDGAHMAVASDLLNRAGVHFRATFFSAHERAAVAAGADVQFVPSDFRRFAHILAAASPRVMVAVAAPPDDDGNCSLSLHAGASYNELRSAGSDPDRLLIVEVSDRFPRTRGIPPEYSHALHVDEIDVIVRSSEAPESLPLKPITDVDEQIARHAVELIEDGATLQAGIGSVPNAIMALLATTSGGDYGIHSEMFSDGMMALHLAGKVTNKKGFHDGRSITTFSLGSVDLYEWLHGNEDVAFLPVEQVNDPYLMDQNRNVVTINSALAIDLYGQVVADTRGGKHFSGVGGAEDFISGPGYARGGKSLLCMHSTAQVNGETITRLVPHFPAGTVITTPRHQLDYVVTEHGAIEIGGMTVRERARALASLAHPDFRGDLESATDALSA